MRRIPLTVLGRWLRVTSAPVLNFFSLSCCSSFLYGSFLCSCFVLPSRGGEILVFGSFFPSFLPFFVTYFSMGPPFCRVSGWTQWSLFLFLLFAWRTLSLVGFITPVEKVYDRPGFPGFLHPSPPPLPGKDGRSLFTPPSKLVPFSSFSSAGW